jgi:hypothetical protein
MAEREFKVEQYGVDYVCDECGEHPMKSDGPMLPTHPPKFRHECPCGAVKMLEERYPLVRFRSLGR